MKEIFGIEVACSSVDWIRITLVIPESQCTGTEGPGSTDADMLAKWKWMENHLAEKAVFIPGHDDRLEIICLQVLQLS